MAQKTKATSYGKTDVRYWENRIVKRVFESRGKQIEIPYWQIRLSHLGDREWFNTGQTNKSVAARKAREIWEHLRSHGWEATKEAYKPKATPRETNTIEQFIELYRDSLKRVEYPPSHPTAERYIKDLKLICRNLHIKKLEKLTKESLEEFKGNYLESGRKAKRDSDSVKNSCNALLRNAAGMFSEQMRTKEEPWKVDPPKERRYWKKLAKMLATRSLDEDEMTSADKAARNILGKVVHRYADEIVGHFKIPTFKFARRFLAFFFGRLLNAADGRSFRSLFSKRIQLEERLLVRGYVEHVRELSQKGTIVFVPTHFSNLDSILIGYAMDQVAGLPAVSFGAGLNLYNTGYTAYFMNRLGAYRVDRRKRNPIYMTTLKTMSKLIIHCLLYTSPSPRDS